MRKLLFVLVLASTPAWAEWTYVSGSSASGVFSYAELSTIRKRGNTVKMWTLYDFKPPRRDALGIAYLSAKIQDEYDCEGQQFRPVYRSLHSGNMGRGEIVWLSADIDAWIPVPPQSMEERFWQIACDKQ